MTIIMVSCCLLLDNSHNINIHAVPVQSGSEKIRPMSMEIIGDEYSTHNTAEPRQIFLLHYIRPVGDRGGRQISVDDSCGRIRLGRSCLVPCAPKNRYESKALISDTTKMWIAMGEQGMTSSINSQFSHGVPLLPLHVATTLAVCYSDKGYMPGLSEREIIQ